MVVRPRQTRPAVGRVWRAYAALAVWLRYVILLAWIAAAVAAIGFLPQLTSSGSVSGLIPRSAPAVQAEYQATRLFGLPLTAQMEVVQHAPDRFSRQAQLRAVRQARALDQGKTVHIPGLAAAVPVANTNGRFPGSRQRSTTIITFLFSRPNTSVAESAAAGQAYTRRFDSAPQDHLAGVTGPVPAEAEQASLVVGYLPWMELATVLAIALIVGIYFRAPGAPLASLACSATAYLAATRVVAWVAHRAGETVAPDLEPVLVVLLLGVTTDYSVFFLAGMRARLAGGLPKVTAARATAAEFTPIILTAGLVVAAGIASLAVANIGPLRTFGPALALTVLIAMLVAITLTPALIGIFGRVLFLPGPASFRSRRRSTLIPAWARTWRESAARLATNRVVASLVALTCVAGLLLAALGLRDLRLGYRLIAALPASAQPVRAQAAADRGFAPGILSPTEVLVLEPGVTRQLAALTRLEHLLAQQPGVAGVVGPADYPSLQRSAHVTLARSGTAARYGLIQRTNPLGPAAIGQMRSLRRHLPALLREAGLGQARYLVGGETALAGEGIAALQADLNRIAFAIGLVILVLLAIFLRSVLAPLYLLAASALALLAALGLTTWIFHGLLGYPSLVYYVPFVVAVLLVSLGSDYNVFVVGRIWEEARRRPLPDAVAVAVPRASRTITTAGLALAVGFGLLALVPLAQFREIALAMVIGIVIDTFVVRTLLVPALVVLFGRAGLWPGGRRVPKRRPAGPQPRGGAPDPVTPAD